MNFGFTEEQNMLREQVRRFMQEACAIPRVRELMSTESAFDGDLWQQISDLGWLGLIIPESNGGLGLKWVDLTVVLEPIVERLDELRDQLEAGLGRTEVAFDEMLAAIPLQ